MLNNVNRPPSKYLSDVANNLRAFPYLPSKRHSASCAPQRTNPGLHTNCAVVRPPCPAGAERTRVLPFTRATGGQGFLSVGEKNSTRCCLLDAFLVSGNGTSLQWDPVHLNLAEP